MQAFPTRLPGAEVPHLRLSRALAHHPIRLNWVANVALADRVFARLCLYITFALWTTAAFAASVPTGSDRIHGGSPELREYQQAWLGVAAPELGPDAQDRMKGPAIRLDALRGRRILLFAFDSGNFVEGADDAKVSATLEALERVRNAEGPDKFRVVAFSAGIGMFPEHWGIPVTPEMRRLTAFPIVNPTRRHFAQPHAQLADLIGVRGGGGGIVVDRNGVIVAFFNKPMTEREMRKAAAMPDWAGAPRPAPESRPAGGLDAPIPTHDLLLKWRRPWPRVAGVAAGPWLAGDDDQVLVVESPKIRNIWVGDLALAFVGVIPAEHRMPPPLSKSWLHVLRAFDGAEQSTCPLDVAAGASPLDIRMARIAPGRPVFSVCNSGWPSDVPVFDTSGSLVWKYKAAGPLGSAGVDSAAWADLAGDGMATLVVGFNGAVGLHLVGADGQARWSNTQFGNIWCVDAIAAAGGRPAVILCSESHGQVHAFDPVGKHKAALTPAGTYVTTFAAAEMTPQGERQILSIEPERVVKAANAVCRDMDGKPLWRWAMGRDERLPIPSPLRAADMTGDGTKEWIVHTADGEIVVLGRDGALLARLPGMAAEGAVAVAAVRGGKPLIVVARENSVEAYELMPRGAAKL